MTNSKGLAFATSPNNEDEQQQPTETAQSQHTEGETIEESKILQLPESDPNADIPTIKLGESIKFEEMGPVIINSDGTTRRINNWNEMTKKEQEVTWRRISKRNEERRKMLLEQQENNAAGQEQGNDEL
eukprot:CAMPEP_0202473216 /NCGR_PEP_ID=MMETSP1360-20130828/90313_1 /ASSEMBLY_ACC=CAM_ASM_000848 /TAXON_ID=515479 /ORGANISM="Licmophora paradoxa, Strain CCMP2313" /LENGTH=128 /DNA_ID=CAMNT_0049100029 /DNA_START=54 /DNA_END=440 /DNA_ORIENTATION=-